MKGLLYRDFLMINGKKICTIILCGMVILTLLRIALPGTSQYIMLTSYYTADDNAGMVTENKIPIGSMYDLFFSLIGTSLCLAVMMIPLNLPQIISKSGEDRNYQKYINGMPIGKKNIIAERYAFAGILIYVAYSVSLFGIIIVSASCIDEKATNFILLARSLVPALACYALLCYSIIFPATFRYGTDISKSILNGIYGLLFIVVICYFSFADWKLFKMVFASENTELLDYIVNKQDSAVLIQVLAPIVSILIYYVSYRVALVIGIKEYDND